MSALSPSFHRRTFPAMGNTAVIEVPVAHAHLLEPAAALLMDLELRWSRFNPASEVSRLNAAVGSPLVVSGLTALLVEYVAAAKERTAGLFDASVLGSVIAAGYDRSLVPNPSNSTPEQPTTTAIVALASPLDPGGIGKGLAADLALAHILAEGAPAACVAVGGDLAFFGEPRPIPVLSPFDGTPISHVALHSGGVATSSIRAKTFEKGGRSTHHVFDPATGLPAAGSLVQATVVASTCAWAEAFATATLVSGSLELVGSLNFAAMAVHADGSTTCTEAWGPDLGTPRRSGTR